MKTLFLIPGLILGVTMGSVVALAAEDSDTDRANPEAFVKDSVITTKIKSSLAAKHITSMGRIHVDTDKNGVVWLTGSARTQSDIDQAVSIAKETEGVKSVHNSLQIKKDD